MREVELKSVVDDVRKRRKLVEAAGGKLVFEGELEDRRYDTADRALAAKDEVLRIRVYRNGDAVRAELNGKGPTNYENGYKVREEVTAHIGDGSMVGSILERTGFIITREIFRSIAQYEISGATVRFEHYPRMDDLVEVEGDPAAIERAIAVLQLPRDGFSAERLPDFVKRFEARTGDRAALSDRELLGEYPFRPTDA